MKLIFSQVHVPLRKWTKAAILVSLPVINMLITVLPLLAVQTYWVATRSDQTTDRSAGRSPGHHRYTDHVPSTHTDFSKQFERNSHEDDSNLRTAELFDNTNVSMLLTDSLAESTRYLSRGAPTSNYSGNFGQRLRTYPDSSHNEQNSDSYTEDSLPSSDSDTENPLPSSGSDTEDPLHSTRYSGGRYMRYSDGGIREDDDDDSVLVADKFQDDDAKVKNTHVGDNDQDDDAKNNQVGGGVAAALLSWVCHVTYVLLPLVNPFLMGMTNRRLRHALTAALCRRHYHQYYQYPY
jgi:hypothetical protein